jgi:plasmid stabilization system protein ParE
VAAIGQAANGLADLPYRWRKIPELDDHDRRETFGSRYRRMCRVAPGRIRILRVVHGQRLLTSVPGSFEESPQAEMPRCMSTAAA